ncbi:hypothetical protein AFL94_15715 [Arthrobacter sp. LS16]|nr:hypothetical protein AFL94_15715 [Arthrobacter sp. LS16]
MLVLGGYTLNPEEPENVRCLLTATDVHEFHSWRAVLEKSVKSTQMIEAKSLCQTLILCHRELLVFIRTWLT